MGVLIVYAPEFTLQRVSRNKKAGETRKHAGFIVILQYLARGWGLFV